MATDATSDRITPRRASSVASRLARAASDRRRMRPHRSISQLAVQQRLVGRLRIRIVRRVAARWPASVVRCALAAGRRSRPAGRAPSASASARAAACSTLAAAILTLRLLRERLVDQLVEHRVVELLPPRGVRRVRGVLRARSGRRRAHRPSGARSRARSCSRRAAPRRRRATASAARIVSRPPAARRRGARRRAGAAAAPAAPAFAFSLAALRRAGRRGRRSSGTYSIASVVSPIMPPMMPVPIEWRALAPAPSASASGRQPNANASEVMMIGRSRCSPASDRRLHDRLALLAELDGGGHAQHRVLRAEADQHQQADLEVDVVLEAAQPVGERARRGCRTAPRSSPRPAASTTRTARRAPGTR